MKRLLKTMLLFMSKPKLVQYIFLGLLSGLFSFIFVNLITRVISLIVGGTFTSVNKEYIFFFALVILLFVWTRRTLSLAITNLSQIIFWNLRKQIALSVLSANYQQLSERRSRVATAVLSDVHTLMDAAITIIQFSSSVILSVSCMIYLLSISLVLFSITLGIALLGITVYHFSSGRNIKKFQIARKLENEFQENFNSILNGFKEINMDPRKGRYIYDHKISPIAERSFSNNMGAFAGYINNQITGQVLFYILISSVLLIFSVILNIKPSDAVSFAFTLLYLLGSIEAIMVLLPGIMRARIASNEIIGLKEELENEKFDNQVPKEYAGKDGFDQIVVENLEFSYGGKEESFGIGPINFDIQKGEVVFIYGGNGSGKTTFVHSVIGLRFPSAGEIRFNGIPVGKENYPTYKTLFSVVFSDFYLFNEVLGVDNIDEVKWNYYIDLFELENKVTVEGRKLSTTDLSTGQRKRLALIVALLEERPILVIDEWAADQDPYFRKKFYTEIIPALKKDGFSIIAITHDDKFYHCADKLFKMEYGKLIEESVNTYERSLTA